MPTGANFKDFQTLLKAHEESARRKRKAKRKKKSAPSRAAKPKISEDDLKQLAEKAKDEDKALKPVFLSKKAREAAALERLEEKRKIATTKDLGMVVSRRKFERSVADDSRKRYRRDRDRKTERDQSKSERDVDKRMKELKEAYLGRTKPKKRFIPPSQKFKFSFDWEASDDTSTELDPLYQKKHVPALMYGRGFLGGQDRREQRKAESSRFYDELIQNREDEDDEEEPTVERVKRSDKFDTLAAGNNQRVAWMAETGKEEHLIGLLRKAEPPVVVYCCSKGVVRAVARCLEAEGFTTTVLHKAMGKDDRERSLKNFRTGSAKVLVATDVLGGGIEAPCTLTVNYDLPRTVTRYEVRIQRSGGNAVSFATDMDADVLEDLAAFLTEKEGADAIPSGMQAFLKTQQPQGPMPE